MSEIPPAVSVIMPNYNKGPYVSQAIQSVFDQTFKDFELIVVDDASTDDSLYWIRNQTSRDSRARLILHDRHLGGPAARNTGLRCARGKYVANIDSDDVFSPTWLEHGLRLHETAKESSVVYADWWVMGGDGSRIRGGRWHTKDSGRVHSSFLVNSLEANTAVMAPKTCFLQAGLYDESLAWASDYDMVLRLAELFPFQYLDEESYGYRFHEGNSWRRFSRKKMYEYKASMLERHIQRSSRILAGETLAILREKLLRYYALSGQRMKYLGLWLRGAKGMVRTKAREELSGTSLEKYPSQTLE